MIPDYHHPETMPEADAELRHSWLHRAFFVSMVIKGFNGAVELAAGIGMALVSAQWIHAAGQWLAQVLGSPQDYLGGLIMQHADKAAGDRRLIAAYFLSHGILKLFIVTGLLRRWLWTYPVAMAVTALFVLLQGYRLTGHFSWVLLGCTLFDVLAFFLIWREMRKLRELRTLPKGIANEIDTHGRS